MDDDAVSTTTVNAAAAEAPVPPRPRTRTRDAVAGVVAVLAALGASELVAALLGAQSLVATVGGWVIDHQPPGAKDFVVSPLRDERQARARDPDRRRRAADRRRRRDRRPPVVRRGRADDRRVRRDRLPRLARGPAGSAAPQADRRRRGRVRRHRDAVVAARLGRFRAGRTAAATAGSMPDWSRRSFLIRAGSVAAASVVAGVLGRRLLDGRPARPPTHRAATTLPPPSETATLPAGARRSTSRHHPDRHPERPASTGSTPR